MKIFTKGMFLVLFVVSQVAGYAAAEAVESRLAHRDMGAPDKFSDRDAGMPASPGLAEALTGAASLAKGSLLGSNSRENGKNQTQGTPAGGSSLKEKNVPTVSAYPNPTRGVTRLSLTQAAGSDAYKIRISNTIGKVVRTIEVNEFEGSSDITLDLSHLPSGIYFYSLLVNEKMTETKRLVLQR